MEEETTVCTNCQRPISSINYVMHSLHCHRNLEKCGTCGEAVPRSEMSTHVEQHADQTCSECGENVARDLLEAHKANKCKFRKISCLYCSLEMPATELQEHEDYCGSRTELCNDCGKFVMLKYQQLHLESNHGFLKLDDEPAPSPPPKLGDFLVKKSPRQSQLHSSLPSPFQNDPVSSLDRLLQLRLGEDDVQLLSDRNMGSASSSSNREYSSDVELPCEFCSAVMPLEKLWQHQTGCRPDITSFATADTACKVEKTSVNAALRNGLPRRTSSKTNSSSSTDPIYTLEGSDDDVAIVDDGGLEVELPCEFCEMAYPASMLNQHQEICEARIAASNPEHHWSLPAPGGRRVVPPLTRRRLNAEAKATTREEQGAARNVESRSMPPSAGAQRPSLDEGTQSTSTNLQTRSTSAGAVPKQRHRKKRRAPSPPTVT